MKICSVPDCGRITYCRKDYCRPHWRKLKMYGSVESPHRGMTPEEIYMWGVLYRLVYPERMVAATRKWQIKNIDRVKEYERNYDRSYYYQRQKAIEPGFSARRGREYRVKNRERLNFQLRERMKNDIDFRLRCILRTQLNRAVRKEWKTGSILLLLGCSIESFKIYLESKFEAGMSWDSYGNGIGKWSIDHILPCALFDLKKPEHQQRCFHFSNLQPMWSVENSAKCAKVPEGFTL